jgi:acetyltransferase-like isoleucine patch superfamily enzyme
VKLLADIPGAAIKIGDDTRIYGSCIHAWKSIRIGKRCLIAANCHIIDSNGHLSSLENPKLRGQLRDVPKSVEIEDDVWIGAGCIVLPGVTIGKGSIIGAGSVVTGDIPGGVIAAGNPAKIVSKTTVE